MIPVLLGNMFANPKMYEEQLLNYLNEMGFDTTKVEKSIGKMALYHFQQTGGLQSQTFFTGAAVDAQTNVPGNNFVRPEGEHMIIYGIKIEEANGATIDLLDWTPGAASIWAKNANLTVKINGIDRTTQIPLSLAQENLTTSDNGIIMLEEPFIWGGQVPMVATAASKSNLVLAPAANWMRITWLGVGLFS